jgi:ribonucleoside-diphosphate reductase alpha chain
MHIVKRDRMPKCISFDKITWHLELLCDITPKLNINVIPLMKVVIASLYDGVHMLELDCLAAETAATMGSMDLAFEQLVLHIAISNLHKSTSNCFSDTMVRLHIYINTKTKLASLLIHNSVAQFIIDNTNVLNAAIKYKQDYSYTYFGFQTLKKAYLLKINGVITEHPQHMVMCVAMGVYKDGGLQEVL